MSILSRFPSGGAGAAEESRRLLRDRRRADDEHRDAHVLDGQAAYEARIAAQEAKRQTERGKIHEAHLGREAERWAQIGVFRQLRTEIASERQRLIAAVHAAVERGELEAAIDAQQRLAVLSPIDGVASSRLSALGVEK